MKKKWPNIKLGPKLGETSDGPGWELPKCRTSDQITPKVQNREQAAAQPAAKVLNSKRLRRSAVGHYTRSIDKVKVERASRKEYAQVETFLIKTAEDNVIFQRKCDFWTNMMTAEGYSYP